MFSLLTNKFSSLFSHLGKKGTLTEIEVQKALEHIKEALFEADVPYSVVNQFCDEVGQEITGKKVIGSLKPLEQMVSVVHNKIKDFLGQPEPLYVQIPSVILMMGLQGSGKTTTCAKLALHLKKEAESKGKSRKILLASVDFYRPAAIDQLEIVAKQVGADFYRSPQTNPVSAAQDILQYSKNQGYELLFLDTAGRLTVDQAMMQELKTIEQKLQPKHKILVLDSMTGQESLTVAQSFSDVVGFNGVIMTKMDSDTRGGAVFAFRYVMKKPIWFAGVGEKLTDLEPFYPDRVASRIIGMGDLTTLLEKANSQIKQAEQESLYKSMASGSITLNDFAQQLEMMGRMGSLSQLMKYMPGSMGSSISSDKIDQAELELKKFRAIISSMTPKERVLPQKIDGSRKKRIANGAGVAPADVNALLERFEQSKQYVKLLKKFSRFPGVFK